MLIHLLVLIILLSVYVKWRHSYWRRRGVAQMEPDFLIGNARNLLTGKSSFAEVVAERYNTFKSWNRMAGGLYIFLKPVFYPIDPSLIKLILQRDFPYFMGHGVFYHKKDILSMNLFNLEGDIWKNLRTKLTPTFTSGKIKMMFETLVEKTDGLENLVNKYIEIKEPLEIKDVLGRFTTDIIGSCAFGIECNSLEDPDNAFRIYGKKAFQPNMFKFLLMALFPWWLLGNLGFKSNGSDVTSFFTKVVKDTIKARETGNIFRKDFMHLLIQLKKYSNDNSRTKEANNEYIITENEIIAQCFIFFLAGFETSSTTMTFALLELAQNFEIQEKLREEINLVLKKHNNEITYDAAMEMLYLDKVINETLRKYPPVPAIPRVCTKNYQIPGTETVIEKGTRVHIPVWGLHRDPQYYPDPERFDPERFNDENKAKRPDFTFLPFGEGPRMCIGLRFGMLQSKVGLISLLRNFRFTLSKKTPLPIQMARGNIIISVKGEVWLDAERVDAKLANATDP